MWGLGGSPLGWFLVIHQTSVLPSWSLVLISGAPGKGNPQVLSLVKCIYSEGWEEGSQVEVRLFLASIGWGSLIQVQA